ncbi:hypothetical protein HY994_00915 [Candidatus Micrarchaeota archaeon]|nr:hypothetical protein [Candidatus Micrarchaeota archaeon]
MTLRPFVFFLVLLAFAGLSVSAATPQVLVNSQDWKDVYAGMMFGQWQDTEYNVVTNAEQGKALLDRIGLDKQILLVESATPYLSGYADLLKSRGFDVVETLKSTPGKPAGLELARKLNASAFVVMDGTYGYNAISVIPYALRQKKWVLFSEDLAPADLTAFLQGQRAVSVLQYGRVRTPVKDALAPLNPEVLDLGDRFSNNVALLKRLDALNKPSQIFFSDGTFIERTLFSSNANISIILVGPDAVPAVSLSYLKSAGIPFGVLIGTGLSELGRWIKKNTPTTTIFVKFAQTFIKGPGVTEPWVLDQTYLPKIPMNVSIGDMRYNALTKQLEVTYQNEVGTPTYLQAALEAFVGNASIRSVLGTPEVVLEPGATKAVAYDFDLPESAFPQNGGNVSVQVSANYGAEQGALDHLVQKRQDNLVSVSFDDACVLSLLNVSYDSGRQGFRIGVHNDAATACFLVPFLTYTVFDLPVPLSLQRLSMEGQSDLDLFFYAPLKNDALQDLQGSTLRVHLDYGAREAYLIKTLDEDRLFSLQGASVQASSMDWTLVGGVLVALAALAFFFTRGSSGGGSGSFSARRRL